MLTFKTYIQSQMASTRTWENPKTCNMTDRILEGQTYKEILNKLNLFEVENERQRDYSLNRKQMCTEESKVLFTTSTRCKARKNSLICSK